MAEDFDVLRFAEVMEGQGSDAFTFAVKRERTPNRTISAEAVEQMALVFQTFVLARLKASLARHPEGHELVQMDLTLTIDGESHTVSEDLHPWWSLVDGEHRSH